MKTETLLLVLCFLCGKANCGCSPPITESRKDVVESITKKIGNEMESGDEIVWGKIDSVKYLNIPKDLFYEGYNVGEESKIISLSETVRKRNPYLSAFERQYVWFFTVKSKMLVYKGQIGEKGSECSYEYLVRAGQEIPFVKSSQNGALKEIEYFYNERGYQMIPGNEILGKIGLKINWPEAPSVDSNKK
jgi:hypothetical protein